MKFPICRRHPPFLSRRSKITSLFVARTLLICRTEFPYLSRHVPNLSPPKRWGRCVSIGYSFFVFLFLWLMRIYLITYLFKPISIYIFKYYNLFVILYIFISLFLCIHIFMFIYFVLYSFLFSYLFFMPFLIHRSN